MSKIELKYFPIHGFRGLLARMVLHLGEIDHNETIISFEEWETLQASNTILVENDFICFSRYNSGILTRAYCEWSNICAINPDFKLSLQDWEDGQARYLKISMVLKLADQIIFNSHLILI